MQRLYRLGTHCQKSRYLDSRFAPATSKTPMDDPGSCTRPGSLFYVMVGLARWSNCLGVGNIADLNYEFKCFKLKLFPILVTKNAGLVVK